FLAFSFLAMSRPLTSTLFPYTTLFRSSPSIWQFDIINLQGNNISVEYFLSMNSFLSKFFQNCSTLFCIYLIYCFLITNVHDIFFNNHYRLKYFSPHYYYINSIRNHYNRYFIEIWHICLQNVFLFPFLPYSFNFFK